MAPSCFFLVFGPVGFWEDDRGTDLASESEDSEEVVEEGSEAEDMEAEGFFESPLIVAEESEEAAWTIDAGCEVDLGAIAGFTVQVGAGASEPESDSDSDSDSDSEADSLLPATAAWLTVCTEAGALLTLPSELPGDRELSESEAEEESEDEDKASFLLGFVSTFLGLPGRGAGVVLALEVLAFLGRSPSRWQGRVPRRFRREPAPVQRLGRGREVLSGEHPFISLGSAS